MSAAKLPSVIHESAMTMDEDTEVVMIDTNVHHRAMRYIRDGFEMIAEERHPNEPTFYRFRGHVSQVSTRKRRDKRKLSPERADRARKQLAAFRERRDAGSPNGEAEPTKDQSKPQT